MMDAIITAGGIPEVDDPLYRYTQGIPKALLEIAGKPMIQWVLDAVNDCDYIERVVIIGLPKDTPLMSQHETIFIESTGDMLCNIQTAAAALKRTDAPEARAFILASDVPDISSAMLDWLYETSNSLSGDIFYTIIKKETMESRYPTSNRTYIDLADCQVCGGDISIFRLDVVDGERPIWNRLIAARRTQLNKHV